MKEFAESRFAIRATALLFATPVAAYMAQNLWQSAISCWRTGWESRPFIYIGPVGIFAFVAFGGVTIAAHAVAWQITRDRVLVWSAISPLAALLGIYGLGFLTSCFGVLHQSQPLF